MKNVFMILLMAFAFTFGASSLSAQSYVGQEEAGQRIKTEIQELQEEAESGDFSSSISMKLVYFTRVMDILPADVTKYDETFDQIYNDLTNDGQSKQAPVIDGYRTELKQLLQS